jgi:hypothetical protein
MVTSRIARDELYEYSPETMEEIRESMSNKDRKKGETDALNDLQPLVDFLYCIHKKNTKP